MNDSTPSIGYALSMARMLADAGYKLVPIPAGFKYPKGFGKWQEIATNERGQIDEWFEDTTHGIGLAMGKQPNGKFLFAIDIDGRDGMDELIDLLKEHGGQDVFMNTANQNTGNDGAHFIFQADYEVRNSAKRFGDRIDLRGEGGQIVIGPTIHPNGNPYVWNHTLADREPLHAPQWVMDRIEELNAQPPAPSSRLPVDSLDVTPTGRLTAPSDDNPRDWAKKNFDVLGWLLRSGWQEAYRRGDETQLTRPGKLSREGTSATYHHDSNIVNIYTTTVDPLIEQVAHLSAGCYTINGFDAWMIENGHSNVTDAMRMLRHQVMPQSPRPQASAVPESQTEAEGVSAGSMNLPDEFWQARPVLTHIRDAAWSLKTSPDAVLASVLTRYSADLHPSIQLPEWGTLDLFVVIAGASGRFKSKASKTARRLYPGRGDRSVMHDYNVGSGEAIAEVFFEWLDDDGNPCSASKKGARKVLTRWGLHFATDEGEALTASAGRMNSILIPTLCAAWMGEGIGQVLADPTKSRMIPPHQVRVSAEVKIQTMNGWKLFAEAYASTGLSQRMVCFSSIDPRIKERGEAGIEPPEWPGELHLPHPWVLEGGQERVMGLAPSIKAHLDRVAWEGHDYTMNSNPLDTHSDLSRLKLAGIFALWDDRFEIDSDDWHLAGQILDTHRVVRAALRATKASAERDARHTRNTIEAEKALVVDDARHKQTVRDTLKVIEARIEADQSLAKKWFSKRQREVLEECFQILEAQGLVKSEKGGWVKA